MTARYRNGWGTVARPMLRRLRWAAIRIVAVVLPAAAVVASPAVHAVPASAASYQDWPMFLQNSARTAATVDPKLSVASAPTLKLKWSFATTGPVATSTSIVGTTAYVGSWDGYEYAINTSTGAVIWKQFLGTTTDPGCTPVNIGITSSAAVVNGVAYVGGGGPYWYALNATTGAILWKVYTGDNTQAGAHYNWSSPLIVGNYAYIGVASNCDNPLVQGQLLQVAISGTQQGQIINTYGFVPNGQVGGGIWTSPTYDPATNTIFVSTGTLNDHTQTQSQAIVALNATTLQYVGSWQLPFEAAVTDSDWGTTPTLTTDSKGDQLLSVANKNGILYTLNRNNLGAGPIWQHQIAIGGANVIGGDGTIASGVFANGLLYYAGGNNTHGSSGSGGSITAFDPGTGAISWSRQTEQPILGSPAYVNGLLGVAEGSTFEVLNAATGTLLYSYVLPALTYGAISVARSQFYVPDLNGNLYAFGLPGTATPPPTDPNCPTGFTCQDIHSPTVAGSEQTSGGVLTVTAAGTGVRGTGDQFRLLSQPVTGDSQASAQITAQTAQPGLTQQAGVIMRQSTDPASPFYAILSYPNDSPNDLQVLYRAPFAKAPVVLAKVSPAAMPVSVMIQRQGNNFSAGYSIDGVNYQLIPGSTADMDMPATIQQGLVVDSGSSTLTGTASFSNISVGNPISTTMNPPAPADPCPGSWTCADIGNPAPPGDTTSSGVGTLTLSGTGSGAVLGHSDSFHYAYQPVSGDQTLSAQVVTPTTPATAQEGLMMRASTSPTAQYYAVLLHPGGSATVQWRSYDGTPSNTAKLSVPSITSPAYISIVRWTDASANPPQTYFSTLTSTDGTTWTPVLGSTAIVNMGSNYLAGLAATSGTPGATPQVTYNNVTFTATSSQPPGICATGYTCNDVGTDILPGNQDYLSPQQGGGTSGTWNILAGGSDLWGNYDNFRFISQSFPQDPANSPNGDGTISARVVSQSAPNDPWEKTGVVIRSGPPTDPQAPYYGVLVTPGHGVVVQWRTTQAGQTSQVAGSATATTPIWVMASRYTDTARNVVYYSAYTSTDGVNFTFVPRSTVALSLPAPLLAGIATDSHNSTTTASATVDNLASLPGSQAPPGICPASWTCADIGGALPPGQDQLNTAGTWTESAGGGDIWGTADSFHLVAQTLSADGTVTAQVTGQQNTSPWAKAGPMIRATNDPGSPYYGVFITPGNGIAVQWRATQGGTSSEVLTPGAVPAYLMVGKYTTTGSNPQTYYTAYESPDGSTWTAIPGSTKVLGFNGPALAGFAITSHSQGTAEAVTLNSVAVTPGELQPPGICPNTWSCADIGNVAPAAGGQNLSGSSWTVTGGGSDIWGTTDSFHYVWQPFPAGGTVSAQIVSQTNTSVWAKGGLMIRATTDPGSPYYAIFATPGNGIVVQWRTTQAGTSSNRILSTGTVPVYLQITQTGTTFTAATSSDGVTWTPVPNSSVTLANLAGGALAGLAVTSHNTGQLGTVTYGSVVVAPS
ncbi:MAG TPA: PQQ-binding-like beta-propeller repeat protein [Streptosporangiaceae bacterium]